MDSRSPLQASGAAGSTPDPRRWVAVVAVGLSIVLSALDGTIVALAAPAMARQFQLSASAASLIFLSYSLPLTLLILPAAELLRRFRTLPLFLVAVLGFGLGSVLCGVAPAFPMLLAGRIVQGSFAAVIATQGIAVAAAVVAPRERGRAMGLIGSLAPLGGVAGPSIGGVLLTRFDWHAVFFVNVPVCAVAAALGLVSLRGVSLMGGARSGVQQMAGLLRRPPFLWGLVAFLASITVSAGLYYLFPFDLSVVQRIAPATAGLLLLCVPLGMGALGFLGGYLTDRYGARRFILLGSGLLLAGLALLAPVLGRPTAALDIAWRLLLIGAGIGLFTGPNQTLLMSAGPREAMPAASALANLSARVGAVGGPLLVGLLWAALPGVARQMTAGVVALIALAALTLVAGFIAVQSGSRGAARPIHAPAAPAGEGAAPAGAPLATRS
ncbi:MAG TPA: MFS transporter [Ktedonobacterales bacterium]|nr:MFS transporter [Ktedonobacterales bacterium]